MSIVVKEKLVYTAGKVKAALLVNLDIRDQSLISKLGTITIDFGGSTYGSEGHKIAVASDPRIIVDGLRVEKTFQTETIPYLENAALAWQDAIVALIDAALTTLRSNGVFNVDGTTDRYTEV
jgi:hypothetical protein